MSTIIKADRSISAPFTAVGILYLPVSVRHLEVDVYRSPRESDGRETALARPRATDGVCRSSVPNMDPGLQREDGRIGTGVDLLDGSEY